MDIVAAVAEFVSGLKFRPGEALVMGISGGPDSVCMLHVLAGLRPAGGPRLIAAHFNHGIRGEEADEDQRFVARLCEQWQVPMVADRLDVPALAEQHRLSLEEAARRARYTFLAQVAQRAGARYLAVGHNADDQVETVLMHFLRGTGLAGMRGMRAVSPLSDYHLLDTLPAGLQIVRPLLDVPRFDIDTYCAERGIEPRQDLSNLDTQYFRNRLRHELIPLLEAEYNPGIRQVIRRSAEVAAGDFDVIEAASELAWKLTVRQQTGQGLIFDARAWRGFPPGLQRMLMRMAISKLRPRLREIRFDVIEAALEVARAGVAGAKATLPGRLLLHVGYDSLTLTSLHDRGPLPAQPVLLDAESLPVEVPGHTALPETDWELVARVLGPGEWQAEAIRGNRDEWQAFLDVAALGGEDGNLPPLFLRHRRAGERFQPLGMSGRVRLTEFMINVKVPQVWRDAAPVLAVGVNAERVVWVCGLRIDDSVRVTESTQRVLYVRFVKAAP